MILSYIYVELCDSEYLKKHFRNDVRYVGSAPERLFVTTYGTSVRRKRVKQPYILVFYLHKQIFYPLVSLIFLKQSNSPFLDCFVFGYDELAYVFFGGSRTRHFSKCG